VSIIEQEIFKSLQGNESSKPKSQNSNDVAQLMQNIRSQVVGNGFCVDCDSPGEFWWAWGGSDSISIFILLNSSRVGESQSRHSLLHRVLGSAQELGFAHIEGAVAVAGRMAAGTHRGDVVDWE
jgi:Arf-GAP with GTPase, ANK repeat and PH domain-containing protein 1/3/4/5/6/9/11